VSIFEEGDQEGTRVDLDTEEVDLADEGDDEASDHLMTLKILDATLQMMISEKEYQAVRLAYVDGLGTASGASEMGISPTTFQTHIRNARRKIEAHGGTLPNRDRGYTAAA
jgi:DNA-directed RNA polymerase specialized sigma24 family protein